MMGEIFDGPDSRRWAGACHLPDRYRPAPTRVPIGAPLVTGPAAEALHAGTWEQARMTGEPMISHGGGTVEGTCWHDARFTFRGITYRVAGPYRPKIDGFRAQVLAGPEVDPADYMRTVLELAGVIAAGS